MRAAVQRFERQLTEGRSGRRRIAVTCGELIGGFLSKRLSVLGEGLEGVEIELRPTNRFVDLTKGEADLALRNKRPASGPLKARRLRAEGYGRFSVFGAGEHYGERRFETFDELRGEAWISLAATMAGLPSATWVTEHIGGEAVRFRMNSTALVLEATHHNRALALLPRFIGLDAEHLVEVYGPVEGMLFEMWVVRRDEGRADPVMERLIGNIESVLGRVSGRASTASLSRSRERDRG
nr:LysR substrate-binding domain-containing protein [Parvularcula maris]